MSRPVTIWAVLAVCALLIVGAMAWSTGKVLDLESGQLRSEAEAELGERVRLSLATMDTAASALLVLENQRPPHHFKAFFEPEDVFTSEFQNVRKGVVFQPSPLLGTLPEFVRLHFEIRPDGDISSPQVPRGNERDLAEQQGISGGSIDLAAADLEELRTLLLQPSAPGTPDATNLSHICLACAPPENWNALPPAAADRSAEKVEAARRDNPVAARLSKAVQDDVSLVQKSKRAEEYGKSLQQVVVATAPGIEVAPFRPVWMADELFAIREVASPDGSRYQGVWLRSRPLAAGLCRSVSHLLANAALRPMAEVSVTSLVDPAARDLTRLASDPLALVTLPWRLDPGEVATASVPAWSALRVSLALGWVALVLALLAAAVLVRGVVKLSERRATFVSSVTHELRTPLTTFHLYSDMLAEGMVRDAEKRRAYLQTMRREATRLNHLIENVLAYSRVERGSARTRHERIALSELASRLGPRLEERARRDDAELSFAVAEGSGETFIDTDLTAVEQIVFNLVDNACKYGLPEQGDRTVGVHLSSDGRRARIAVADGGPGIAPSEEKKLFRPFHKSAADAAHSKPGVGLGLALCRRLAKELGGRLQLQRNPDAGLCFVLELPTA